MNAALVALTLMVSAPPQYRLEVRPVKEVDAVLSQEFLPGDGGEGEWVFAAPSPPALPGQQQTRCELIASGYKPVPAPARQSLVAMSAPVNGPIKVRVRYHAVLRSRKLVRLAAGARPPAVPPLAEEVRKRWLERPSGGEQEFEGWLTRHQLRRRADESDIAFARRVFDHLARNFKYHYEAKMDRHPLAVARAGQSDCGGITALYVTILRRGGIPARPLAGRWALSAQKGETVGGLPFYQTHVKAEFHAAGVGWVPVDPTAGVHQGARVDDTYFGNDPGNFLVLSLPVDHVVVVPRLGKQTIGAMQGFHYWLIGKGQPSDRGQDWQVTARKVPEE